MNRKASGWISPVASSQNEGQMSCFWTILGETSKTIDVYFTEMKLITHAGSCREQLFVSTVCLFLLLYVPSQQLWSLRDGHLT